MRTLMAFVSALTLSMLPEKTRIQKSKHNIALKNRLIKTMFIALEGISNSIKFITALV